MARVFLSVAVLTLMTGVLPASAQGGVICDPWCRANRRSTAGLFLVIDTSKLLAVAVLYDEPRADVLDRPGGGKRRFGAIIHWNFGIYN